MSLSSQSGIPARLNTQQGIPAAAAVHRRPRQRLIGERHTSLLLLGNRRCLPTAAGPAKEPEGDLRSHPPPPPAGESPPLPPPPPLLNNSLTACTPAAGLLQQPP